jgi:hypothetical protein
VEFIQISQTGGSANAPIRWPAYPPRRIPVVDLEISIQQRNTAVLIHFGHFYNRKNNRLIQMKGNPCH